MHTRQSTARNSFTPSHWQADVQLPPGKKGSLHIMVSWEDKCHLSKCPPKLSYPSFYCWAWCHMMCNIPLVSLGQLYWLSPPSFLCNPSLLAGRAAWEAEKPLALCKHCPEAIKTSVCYHLYLHQKSQMQGCMASWRKLTLSQPKPQHSASNTKVNKRWIQFLVLFKM